MQRSHEENIEYNKDIFFTSLRSTSVQFLFVIILFLTAYIIYRKYPSRIISKNNLRLTNFGKDELFLNEVNDLCIKSGVPTVRFYSSKSVLSPNAQAFGFKNNPIVRLDYGLRLVLRKSREMFDAILTHEFGHIINKDVAKTYFTQSLWYSALIVFIIPLLIFIFLNFIIGVYDKFTTDGISIEDFTKIIGTNIPAVIKILIQFTILFALLAYARASVLKIREYYADQRVAQLGFSPGLLKVLSMNVQNKKLGVVRKLFRLHPDAKQRIEAVNSSYVLFETKSELFFVTGILVAIIVNGLTYPLISFALLASSIFGFGGVIEDNYSLSFFIILLGFIIPFCILYSFGVLISYFISQSALMQTVKSSFAQYIQGIKHDRFPAYIKNAFLLTLGCELGFWILPISTLIPLSIISFFLIIILDLFLMMIILTDMFAYNSIGTRFLLNSHAKSSYANRFRLMSFLNSLILSVFIIIIFSLRIYIIQNF